MLKYLVEAVGTYFLMLAILLTGNWLVIGLTLAVVILIGGPLSGGSFNPAVTLALHCAHKLPMRQVLPYIVAEVIGALAAVEVVKRFRL